MHRPNILNSFSIATHTEIQRFAASPLCRSLCGEKPFGSRHWEYPWAVRQSDIVNRNHQTILDVAPDLTFPYARYMKSLGHSITFIDIERKNWAPNLAWGIDPKQARDDFMIMDVREMTFPDETFDSIFCISVLEHIVCPTQDPDHPRLVEIFDPDGAIPALIETRRCLKKGGKLIMTVDIYGGEQWWPHFSRWDIFSNLHEAGFQIDKPPDFNLMEVFRNPDTFVSDFYGPYITLGFCLTKEDL